MTIQLNSSPLNQVNQFKNSDQYANAYIVINNYLNANSSSIVPGSSDADAKIWFDTVCQVNSGQKKFLALMIRANNVVAPQYEKGVAIDMFGPEQKAASDAVAKAILDAVVAGNGVIPGFQTIYNLDSLHGMGSLGLSPAGRRAGYHRW